MTMTPPRLLQVRRSARITPKMIRVTLGGDELAGFPGDGPDRRVKMFFPVEGQDRPAVPRASTGGPVWPPGEARPTIRTYTVRRFDASAGELDVERVAEGIEPARQHRRVVQPGTERGIGQRKVARLLGKGGIRPGRKVGAVAVERVPWINMGHYPASYSFSASSALSRRRPRASSDS